MHQSVVTIIIRNFYKPSGKVSPAFFLYQSVIIAFFIPAASLVFALITFYLPIVMAVLIAAVVGIFVVTLLGTNLCIKKGKVRNKKIAAISASLNGLAFTGASLLFYCALRENRLKPADFAAFITNPPHMSGSVQNLLEQGVTLSIRLQRSYFTLGGGLLVTVWSIGLLTALIFLIFASRLTAGKPFNENRKQWAKEFTLKFAYIEEHKADFIGKLRSGNNDHIFRLPVLSEVNVSHSVFELYAMEDSYYLTVENKKAKPPDKNGKVKYDDDKLFSYLHLDKQTGDALLSKQMQHDRKNVDVAIVSKKTKRKNTLSLLKEAAISGLLLFAVVQAYRHGQIVLSDLSGLGFIIGGVSVMLYYLLCIIGSFMKEDVIVLEDSMFEDDGLEQDTTDPYRIEQKDSGALYKIFYLLMFAISAAAFAYVIYLLWG